MALPPLGEQKAIVDRIAELDAESHRRTTLYDSKLAALEALKKSLLHQAFTGKLKKIPMPAS
jgi:type I restriction enzyme S subunit